jgi:hypothetical protein
VGVRWNSLLAVVACLALWAGAETRARAEGVDLTPSGPKHLALGGDLGYFADDQGTTSVFVLAPRIAGHYALNQRWSIAGDFGVVITSQNVDSGEGDEVAFGLGNPTAFALYRGELGALRYRVGLGGAAPLARIDRDGSGRLSRLGYSDAQAQTGLWDVWIYAPARGAVIGYGKLEGDLHPELQFEVEGAPALMIPAWEAFGDDPVQVFLPLALTLSTAKGPVRFGLRGQAVFMPADDPDALQLSLEPQLRVTIKQSYIEVRYTANLDEPLAGERGPRVWGFHLAAGGSL